MIELTPLFEFSRTHCVAICTFLVPANLLATCMTLGLVFGQRPRPQIRFSVGIAASLAVIMCLHVATWFMIGVVMAQTFILLGLGATCLVANGVAVVYPHLIQRIMEGVTNLFISPVSENSRLPFSVKQETVVTNNQ